MSTESTTGHLDTALPRFAPSRSENPWDRLSAGLDRLRWHMWQCRYACLRGQPPMRLGTRAKLEIVGAGALLLGERVTAYPELGISAQGTVKLGDDVFLGRGVNIACYGSVEIGAGTRLGERVSIHDSDHVIEPLSDLRARRSESSVSPVRIGARVWLASNVVVVKGVTIGDDAVIGANSVVTRDVPPGVLAAGTPARVLRVLAS